MLVSQTFGIAAGAVSLISLVLYVRAIWRGETKPNRVTYWVWFALSCIIFFSYRTSGGTTVWLQLMYVLNPLVIALHSLWFGERHEKLERWAVWLNYSCLAIALVSIPLWWFLNRTLGQVATAALPILCLNIFADAMGAIPTFEKAWNRPETEDRKAWLACLLGATLNLAAVTRWGMADVLWNGWMWGAALIYVLFVYLRPHSTAVAFETESSLLTHDNAREK